MAELGSDARAILDLSLRYGFSDERLAAMLQLGLDDVAVRRELALSELAVRAGLDPETDRARLEHALREVPHETWIGRELRDPAPEPELEAADREPPPPPPEEVAVPAPEPSSSGYSWRWIAALLALGAVAVAIAVIVPGGDDQADESAPEGTAPAEQPVAGGDGAPGNSGSADQGQPQGGGQNQSQNDGQGQEGRPNGQAGQGTPDQPTVSLNPVLGAAPSTATIRLVGEGPPPQLALRFNTRADNAAIYEVWLYDTVIDAQSLGKLPRKGGTLRFTLPDASADYRYLDISEEKPGGFPGHSGRSVDRIGLPAAVSQLGLGG